MNFIVPVILTRGVYM